MLLGVELRVSSAPAILARCRSSFSEDRFRGRTGLETEHVYAPQFVCTRPEPNDRVSAPFENRRTMNSADSSGFSAKSPKLRSRAYLRAKRTHTSITIENILKMKARFCSGPGIETGISKSLISRVVDLGYNVTDAHR